MRKRKSLSLAFAAYEALDGWDPASKNDLLAAHGLLMAGLVDDPGRFRSGGVGVFKAGQLLHVAPPADRVPPLMGDLLGWLKTTDEHPAVASCIVHYELEFIHPFADGNGRMGRLWQTLVRCRWKPLLAYLPVETVIHGRQENYYRVLAEADSLGNATPFVEFMLQALSFALREAVSGDQVTDQVARLIRALGEGEMGSADLMDALDLSHRATFRKNALNPALAGGWIERTQPNSPRSPTQRYRLTAKARRMG